MVSPTLTGDKEDAHSPVPSDSEDALEFEDAGEGATDDEGHKHDDAKDSVEFDMNDELNGKGDEGATSLQEELGAEDGGASRPGSLASTIDAPATPKAEVQKRDSLLGRTPSESSPATGRLDAPKKAKGAGVAALLAKFQSGDTAQEKESKVKAPSSTIDPPQSGAVIENEGDVKVAEERQEEAGEKQGEDAREQSQEAGETKDATGVEEKEDGKRAEETKKSKSVDNEEELARRQAAMKLEGNTSEVNPALDEALTLTADKETLPPSKGATSLLDPDETITNPFASSSPWSEMESPFAEQQKAASSSSAAADPQRFSSSTSAHDEAHTQAHQTPGQDSSVARFSTVSLATTAPVSTSRRQTLNYQTPAGAAAKLAGEEPSSASLESAAFVKRQNARLSRDGAVNRNSARGDEFKEKLNAIRAKDKHSHSRQSSMSRQHSSRPNGPDQEAQDEAPPPQVGEMHEQQTTPRPSQQADDDDHWDGPPGEELGDESIDWDFWGDVMSNYQDIARTRPRQLSRAIQTGIPGALRGMMWQLMSSSKDEELELIYAFYLKQTSPHEKNIRKDLARTFPEQDYFQDGKGIGQENLFNVVKAYSLYDEECGYCQGMQFVVGPLLLNMPDEEAFSTLVRLMKSYDLRGHFIPNMPSLQLRLFQYDRLLEDCLPLLSKHLTRNGIKSSMYASGWFMTLFSYRCPLDIVLRILDSVFAEGIEALFRFSLALMKKNEDVLLTLPFEEALPLLATRMFDVYKIDESDTHLSINGGDASVSSRSSASSQQQQQGSRAGSRMGTSGPKYRVNEFVRDAFQFKITPFMLDDYASDFEEQVRQRTAHRREVEALKLVNRNLSNKVKELEETLQQVNKEHVDLVKNVVLTKLAKEEMAEELVRYKTMYAEAVLIADQYGASNSPNRPRQ